MKISTFKSTLIIYILVLVTICLMSFVIVGMKESIKTLNRHIVTINEEMNNKVTHHYMPHKVLKSMQNDEDFIYNASYNKRIDDHFMFDINTDNINFNNLSNDELTKLEKICTHTINQGQDQIYISKAFSCLAKIYIQKGNIKDNIYKSINNISRSLEVFSLDEQALILSTSLTRGLENQLPDKFKDLTKYFTGFKDDEIPILNELIQLNIPLLTTRAHYRLHMIHLLGRASIKEKATPNLKLAMEELKLAIKLSNIKADNIMDIALFIDDKYAQHAGVVITSALLNSDLSTLYRFHIIMDSESPLTPDSYNKLDSIKEFRGCEIRYINFPKEIENLDEFKFCLSYCKFSKVIMYRLFSDKLFPDLDRVLYLDSDLLILNDLTYFKGIDLKNYFLAATIDIGFPTCYRNIKVPVFKEFYINSGVTYLNLSKFRLENGLGKIVQAIKDNAANCDFFLPDQDMLNLAFEDTTYYISKRWNDLMGNRLSSSVVPEPISFIKHYAGTVKPWNFKKLTNYSGNSMAELEEIYSDYWRYREITPWKDIPVTQPLPVTNEIQDNDNSQ